MDVTMIALGLVFVVSAVWLVIAALRAPMGYQDRDGYHDGERPRRGEE